jgi:hypothetical protein
VIGLLDALERLRDAVAYGQEPAATSELPAGVQVVRRGETLDHVRVRVQPPVPVDALAERFGPARALPAAPTGSRRVVFDETSPAADEAGCTVIAALDRDGQVTEVVLRRDEPFDEEFQEATE